MDAPRALTLGRLIVDLYAEDVHVPLRHVRSFAKYLGGSAANVAVGMARLGVPVGLLSRVGNDEFGLYLLDRLRAEGVDATGVKTDPRYPTGLAFAALFPPNDSDVLFYRKPCADIHLSVSDLDLAAIRQARLLEVACTALSRSPSREATLVALTAHREAGGVNVLDIDWRPGFWASMEEARVVYQSALRLADIVLANEPELAFAGDANDPGRAAHAILGLGVREVVAKRGGAGSICYTLEDEYTHPGFPVPVLNTLGAGDGFAAAYCYGVLQDWDITQRLRYANAAGGIVVTRHSCSEAMPRREEIEQLLAGHAPAV